MFFFILYGLNGQSNSTDLILNTSPIPKFNDLSELEVSYTANQKAKTVKIPISGEVVLKEEILSNNLFLSLVVRAPKLPNDYKFYDIYMNVPYTQRNKTNTITMCPVIIDGSLSIMSRTIWGTNVKILTLTKKFEFFQIVSEVFTLRRSILKDNWIELHDKDVQVAFKLLEVTRELSGKGFFTTSQHIDDVTSWLINALNNNPQRVKKAFGGNTISVKQIIKQIQSIKGIEFKKAWKSASGLSNSRRKYDRLKMVVEYHNDLPSNELRNEVLEIAQITKSIMVNDLANAFNYIMKTIKNDDEFFREVNYNIQKIDDVVEEEPESDFKKTLIKSRNYFSNLMKARLQPVKSVSVW